MNHENYYQQFLNTNPYPRELKNFESIGTYIEYKGKKFINFASSDYLGLARHPLLIARCQEFAKKYGVGSSASRLVSGNFAIYETLENQLAQSLGKPAALIFGTGYQTNVSVLECLLDPKVLGRKPLVFCDKLCHVSMLSSTRHLSQLIRFQHNDLHHLERLLEKYIHSQQPKFILAESIYSMEGDQSDLSGLIALAKRHDALLYIDDAHAVGIDGLNGWGRAAEYANEIDVIMGTFSKALGSFGGYIACSQTIRDYLINKCRGIIYSTALPPSILGIISAVLELVPTLNQQREELKQKAKKLRTFFLQKQLDCGAANTHIVPWIIGDAKKTLRVSQLLEEQGIFATTIRPPSVPIGRSRIRFCVSVAHTWEHIEQLLDAIQKVEPYL